MKYNLPIYSNGDIVDRTDLHLTHPQIQELLDAVCACVDNGEIETLKEVAIDLWIADAPTDTHNGYGCTDDAQPASVNYTIPAECHSDDYVVELKFDARRYFEQASDLVLQELWECDFGGYYPADNVAEFFQKTSTEAMFDYLLHKNRNCDVTGEITGFECRVDSDAAKLWIQKNRPNLFKSLDKD